MNLTYVNSYENTVKSRLAFNDLFPNWKRRLRRSSAVASILVLLFLLYKGYELKMGFSSHGVYYPIGSLIFYLVWSVPISIFVGWLVFRSVVASRENAIRNSFQNLPHDYFGQTFISFDQEGVSITTSCYEIKNSWKMINSIKASNDFIFFTFGDRLIFSVPASSLGSQPSEFVAQVEDLMPRAQPTSTETRS